MRFAPFLLLLAPVVASADTSLTATGSATTGYSTNILGVPEGGAPGVEDRVEGDGFTDLAPGLAAAYEHRRGTHNLTYVFGARLFLRNSEANSFNNTLIYRNVLATSARGSVRMSAGFNSGRINGFDQAGSDVVGAGDQLPDGDVEFISYNASLGYRHQLSQNWTGEALLFGGKFLSTGGGENSGETTNLEQQLRLDRGFRRHRLGVDFRIGYNDQELEDESQRTLRMGPGMFWVWNLSPAFSTNASAGIDVVGEYPTLARGITVPRASAAVTYSHERGRATMGWAHGVAINLFAGDTTINDQYFVNLALPVPTKRPMAVGLTAAYSSGEIIDITIDEARGTTKRISADANLTTQLSRIWRLGVRLQTSKQTQTERVVGMDVEAITKQTLGMIVLQGSFPSAVAAQVRPRSTDRVESGETDFAGDAAPTDDAAEEGE